eukprot:g671.t1
MPKQAKRMDKVTRECTINLNKRLHRVTYKKKAPRAIKAIKEFARKMMGTQDVRIDTSLNKAVWQQGVRRVPRRLRVRLQRKRNEDDEATEKFFTLVTHVLCNDFKGHGGGEKGLETKTVDEE